MLFLAKKDCINTWTSDTVAVSHESQSLTAKKRSVILMGCLPKWCAALITFKLTPFSWKGYTVTNLLFQTKGKKSSFLFSDMHGDNKTYVPAQFLKSLRVCVSFQLTFLLRNCCNAWGLTFPLAWYPALTPPPRNYSESVPLCQWAHTLHCHLQVAPPLPAAAAPLSYDLY